MIRKRYLGEALPYTARVLKSFVLPRRRRVTWKGWIVGGRWQRFTESGHLTPEGVRYNRLLRLRRRINHRKEY